MNCLFDWILVFLWLFLVSLLTSIIFVYVESSVLVRLFQALRVAFSFLPRSISVFVLHLPCFPVLSSSPSMCKMPFQCQLCLPSCFILVVPLVPFSCSSLCHSCVTSGFLMYHVSLHIRSLWHPHCILWTSALSAHVELNFCIMHLALQN